MEVAASSRIPAGQAAPPPDAAAVRRILSDQFPRIPNTTVRFIAGGWDYWVYEVSNNWILRFPKRESGVLRLQRESRILPVLEHHLSILVPRYELLGQPCEDFPWTFVGYRKMEGLGMGDFCPMPDRQDKLARQIGHLLTQLHNIPTDDPALVELPTEDRTLSHWRRTLVARLNQVSHYLPDKIINLARIVLGERREIRAYIGAYRVLHNDLTGDNLLFDREYLEVVGIIDWADISLGDPALEFVGLWIWLGDPFLDAVLRNYDIPVDGAFLERIRSRGRIAPLVWLCDAVIEGDVPKSRALQSQILDVLVPRGAYGEPEAIVSSLT